jgi:ESS family glutamate:Na+ symporter
MHFHWSIFIDLGIISCALLAATALRKRVHFFQKYLIPNALTAGFLLLPFYNYASPIIGLESEGLGNLVFHLLNISFIAMTLRTRRYRASGKNIFSMVIVVLSQYSLQSLVGLGITFLFIATIIPNLFPSFGLLITLGFALGPGQAFAIGSGWESRGFFGGGSVGLTFAAIGFLWACFIGMFLINSGMKRGWIGEKEVFENHVSARSREKDTSSIPPGSGPTLNVGAIDQMTYNFAVVCAVYLLTYLLLKGITAVLSYTGTIGMDLAEHLWGIAFIFASLVAVVVKKLFYVFGIEGSISNERLTRIAGLSVDFMVAASIGAISLVVVRHYWLPISVMALLGGIITVLSLLWLSSRLFTDYVFQRTILIYGAMTGTLPTGLALLRVVDPEFETPASSDYMYTVGIVFFFAIPFIFSMNFPIYGYTTGRTIYYWVTFLIYAAYLIFVLASFRIMKGKGAFRGAGKLWKSDCEYIMHENENKISFFHTGS